MNQPYTHIGVQPFHVTLIRPPAVWSADAVNASSIAPPLGLAYLAGALRKSGFSVTVIDSIGEGADTITPSTRNPSMEAAGLRFEEILARIPEATNLIGYSCMFSLEWPATRELIQFIHAARPDIPVVVGGEHATALPDYCLEDCPEIDFLVLGEGEAILVELVTGLMKKNEVESIPGLVWRKDGAPGRCHPPQRGNSNLGVSGRRIRDLAELDWPAWDLTPIDIYLKRRATIGRCVGVTMPILGSRGCPYECTFCSNPTMWGRMYLARRPAEVVEEIVFYQKKYGIEAVEFYDLTPIVTKRWIVEFCRLLIQKQVNIRWQISGGTRCEGIDEEVIVLARQAGCEYIGFAPESGAQVVLDRIKKRIKLSRMLDLIRVARKHNLDTRCNLVIGFPDDSRFEIIRSLLFLMRLSIMGLVDCPVFAFTPYPGSELFSRLRREGVIGKIDDAYFECLGLNIQVKNMRQYCSQVGPLELTIYRTLGMLLFYGIYYCLRPFRLVSFIRNLFHYRYSNSVFEQRIIQNFQKLKVKWGW